MSEHDEAQLSLVAHDSAVHAALLMDLLRMVQRIDPSVVQDHVARAERELREAGGEHGGRHSVLEHRLAYLRSVQIQAAVA
jgi:hypothetical protein